MIACRDYQAWTPSPFSPYRPLEGSPLVMDFGTGNYRLGFSLNSLHYIYWRVKSWRLTTTFSGSSGSGDSLITASGSIDETLNFFDGSSEGLDGNAAISEQERLTVMDDSESFYRHAGGKFGTWGEIRDHDGNLITNIMTFVGITFFSVQNLSDIAGTTGHPVHFDKINNLFYPLFAMSNFGGGFGDPFYGRVVNVKDHDGNIISTGGLSDQSFAWISSVFELQAIDLW